MSDDTNEVQELAYVDKLSIATLTISGIKGLIKTNIVNTLKCWEQGINIEKQTFRVIGPAGVGKTEICKQIAEELSIILKKEFQCMIIKAPVLSRDDFLIPFPIMDNGNSKFKMLYSDFVPMDQNSAGIYVIDEFSRGDHNLQQLLWQVQNEQKVHLMDMPREWFVVTIDNPDDQEYAGMDNLEDAAGLRRVLHLYVEVSHRDFLDYAIQQNFHKAIVQFIQAHPQYIYDVDSQKLGRVYANPASYERLSNILLGYEVNGGIKNHIEDIRNLSSGLLNSYMTRRFIDFVQEMKEINPRDIFFNYGRVRDEVLKAVREKDNAMLGELMIGFTTFLGSEMPDLTDEAKVNVAQYMVDNPVDTATMFIANVDTYSRTGPQFKYLSNLHVAMVNESPEYKQKCYEAMVQVGKG